MIEKINYENGAELLEEFKELPNRAQELLISYLLEEKESDKVVKLFDLLIMNGFNSEWFKSPIETIYALAIYIVASQLGYPELELFLPYQQEEIRVGNKKYIVDFLFDTSRVGGIYHDNDYKLIVECDGHQFHEKTKEQVAYNNERDYNLKSVGYDILHYSGSQIYKDPYGCAKKTIDFLIDKVGNYYWDSDLL